MASPTRPPSSGSRRKIDESNNLRSDRHRPGIFRHRMRGVCCMNNEETWEEACERVGVWKRRQVCDGDFYDPQKREPYRPYCKKCGFSIPQKNPCPPLGDPAAALAMANFVVDSGNYAAWCDLFARGRFLSKEGRALNLAAAVCSLPKENQS